MGRYVLTQQAESKYQNRELRQLVRRTQLTLAENARLATLKSLNALTVCTSMSNTCKEIININAAKSEIIYTVLGEFRHKSITEFETHLK